MDSCTFDTFCECCSVELKRFLVATVLLEAAAQLVVDGRVLRILRKSLLQQLNSLCFRDAGISALRTIDQIENFDTVFGIHAGPVQLIRTASCTREVAERF